MIFIPFHCDDQPIMFKVFRKNYNGKSRHINLRYEYIRKLISNKIINIVYVISSNNLAYHFTKSL